MALHMCMHSPKRQHAFMNSIRSVPICKVSLAALATRYLKDYTVTCGKRTSIICMVMIADVRIFMISNALKHVCLVL